MSSQGKKFGVRPLGTTLGLLAGAALAVGVPAFAAAAPDAPMASVLDELKALHPKPIVNLSPAEARKQPSPADAVKALLAKEGKPTAPEAVGSVKNTSVPGPAGRIPVRVYTPVGQGPFPVVVYFHGGGWVIANLDTYDASARALANDAKAIVVSVDYRQAPEHRFPAAPEDAYAAEQWVAKHASAWHGDPRRVAVAGESAGGNLAAVTCLMAKERHGLMPVHQLLVYPITNNDFNTPSYRENAQAKPLNKPMMQWFFREYVNSPRDASNPHASPLRAADLRGLPPATIVLAQIDPLRSDGEEYAAKLKAAGVPVQVKLYQGVTHEFFGMGAVLGKAKDAERFGAQALDKAFGQS